MALADDYGVLVGAGYASIVAVIPAYNEERFIASVVITTLAYTERVIVVDDGSTDRTAELARLAGADVIQLPRNGGKGQALNRGFMRARELGADVVVMLDGDAQHEPSEIPIVVRSILDGEADVVVGSRFLDTKSAIPGWRQVGQRTLNGLTNSGSGIQLSDSQSGFRAFSPRALDSMRFRSSGLAVESEMQFAFEQSGLRVVEAPISVSYRDGNKRNPVVHGLEVIDALLGMVARRRPLMFFSTPGVVLMAVGMLVGLSVVQVVGNEHVVPLGTALVSALLIIVGLLLALTGVILNTFEHLVSKIVEEVRRSVGPEAPSVA